MLWTLFPAIGKEKAACLLLLRQGRLRSRSGQECVPLSPIPHGGIPRVRFSAPRIRKMAVEETGLPLWEGDNDMASTH